jgi:hypothetical protein
MIRSAKFVLPLFVLAACGDRFPHFQVETAAIKAIQQVHEAQIRHREQFGRYAESLEALGIPRTICPHQKYNSLVGRLLGDPPEPSYRLTMAVSRDVYTIHADRVGSDARYLRTFFSDETLVIRQNLGGGPATAGSKALQ